MRGGRVLSDDREVRERTEEIMGRWPFSEMRDVSALATVWRSRCAGPWFAARAEDAGIGKGAVERRAGVASGCFRRCTSGLTYPTDTVRAALAPVLGLHPAEMKRYDVSTAPARFCLARTLAATGAFDMGRADGGWSVAPAGGLLRELVREASERGVSAALGLLPDDLVEGGGGQIRPIGPKEGFGAAMRRWRAGLEGEMAAAGCEALGELAGIPAFAMRSYMRGASAPTIGGYARMCAQTGMDPLSGIWYEVLDLAEALSAYLQLMGMERFDASGGDRACSSRAASLSVI